MTDPDVPPDQPIPLTGTGLEVFPQGDGAFEKLVDKDVALVEAQMLAIAALADGARNPATGAKNPSVAFLVELPDGRKVFTQTTLRLLLTAVGAIVAVHGDPRT